MKKYITILMVSLICLLSVAVASASPSLLVDEADLLTPSEEATLTARLEEISKNRKMDVAVVTVNSLDGKTAQAFADDYYDYNGYGQGENNDGVLLVVSMSERKWHITTTGAAIDKISNSKAEGIGETILSDLSGGKYSDAFMTYADKCDSYMSSALPAMWIGIALVLGVIVGAIVVAVNTSALKTVEHQEKADTYVKNGSMNVSTSKDIYLFSNVTRTLKPKEKDNDTHVSSSGTSHGGAGGSF